MSVLRRGGRRREERKGKVEMKGIMMFKKMRERERERVRVVRGWEKVEEFNMKVRWVKWMTMGSPFSSQLFSIIFDKEREE